MLIIWEVKNSLPLFQQIYVIDNEIYFHSFSFSSIQSIPSYLCLEILNNLVVLCRVKGIKFCLLGQNRRFDCLDVRFPAMCRDNFNLNKGQIKQ